jgi:hypothetical protein
MQPCPPGGIEPGGYWVPVRLKGPAPEDRKIREPQWDLRLSVQSADRSLPRPAIAIRILAVEFISSPQWSLRHLW